MNHVQLIHELEELTRQLNIQVRYEKGDFDGGYCILKDHKVLVINKKLTDAKRASTLAQAIAEYGIETTFIKPTLRAYIEDEVTKTAKAAKTNPVR
ncbi:MAG: hypothetical protein HYR76_07715 [Ignavibacteria bacterium]|nr:hypothetical protein [Ignavibacteria bacterium]MBI3766120.1 hypothetical protein [Ignavibacteriales bacterium]